MNDTARLRAELGSLTAKNLPDKIHKLQGRMIGYRHWIERIPVPRRNKRHNQIALEKIASMEDSILLLQRKIDRATKLEARRQELVHVLRQRSDERWCY